MNSDTRHRAENVAAAYCQKAKAMFGVEMVPRIVWDEDEGRVEIGAVAASDLDQVMIERLLEREAVLAAA